MTLVGIGWNDHINSCSVSFMMTRCCWSHAYEEGMNHSRARVNIVGCSAITKDTGSHEKFSMRLLSMKLNTGP